MKKLRSSSKIIKIQEKLASKVISKNILPPNIKRVCGVDVSYYNDLAYCTAVTLNVKDLIEVESANILQKVSAPYIPGFFMLREAPPILEALSQLSKNFDLILVDGHGRLHPRKCGLACYIGLKFDKPVIGIAKNLLCGRVRFDSKVILEGKVLGYEINNKKKIYVSVGHKISLRTSVKLVKSLIRQGHWYPEPLRLADIKSKQFRKTLLN